MNAAAADLHVLKAEFHPVRIDSGGARPRRIVVGQLQRQLSLEQSLVSQQLSILRARTSLLPVKTGRVRYTARDPLRSDLLEAARQIFNNHLVASQTLLRDLNRGGSSELGASLWRPPLAPTVLAVHCCSCVGLSVCYRRSTCSFRGTAPAKNSNRPLIRSQMHRLIRMNSTCSPGSTENVTLFQNNVLFVRRR